MSRNFFYRAALLLSLLSLIPLMVFLSRRETPPEKISVKFHQRQTVENFILNSSGSRRWVLKSPLAVFKEKDLIELKFPVLTLFTSPPVIVKAKRALFNRKENRLELEEVELESGQLFASSPRGTYLIEKELFETSSGCLVKTPSFTTSGKVCTLNLEEGEVIITQQVKTVVTGEGK